MPSNYVKKEKKSLFDKIIPRRLQANTPIGNGSLGGGGGGSITPSCINTSSSSCSESPNHRSNTLGHETTKTTSTNNQNNTVINDTPTTTNLSFIGRAVVKHKYTATK